MSGGPERCNDVFDRLGPDVDQAAAGSVDVERDDRGLAVEGVGHGGADGESVAVVVGVASQVIATPIVLLLGLATAVLAPNGGLDPVMVAVLTNVVSLVVSLIVGSVGAVIQSGTLAMLYIDRRMRTEALDLDLQRAVEEREAGRQYTDPYLRAA